ncbi:aldo/keto reductase [Trinickia terrae]|uniref:Aldo/keto reductase n=1 Tax=Trinickia terrae TaxID=2571161 RepID=A0A4V5PL38_9BURK|nr:aldo/keto reductase [Trinickia terrae]TKC82930.1 aldo/keto reductase [Trinickia terrae]
MTNDQAYVSLPGGERIAKLGQGTWEMGERASRRAAEIAALREGIELGMTVIDTAEMYGDGATEELVGEALAGLREQVFLVSKVYPHNASRRGVVAACEASLERLKTDRLDLYLLHWRGGVPLAETIEGFEALRRAGKIRHWGVSNFDTGDMEELVSARGGEACATNQILYNVARRGPEFDLLPWLAARKMPAMAYSPVDHARLPNRTPLDEIARARGVSVVHIALAWVLTQPDVFAIPKAGSVEHVRENRRALDLRFSADELAAIDGYFKPPRGKHPLEML